MAESATKVRMASNFEVLCIQYHSDIDGIHNIAAFAKWNEWTQIFQIIDYVEVPDFGVIDEKVLDAAVDAFVVYGSTVFEGTDYMEDNEIREKLKNYVENYFDEKATFRKWTRATVHVTLEVSV